MSDMTISPHAKSSEKTKVHPKFPKKMFTVSEDAIIIKCVSLYGTNNWNLISQFLPGRTIRQLRERYNTYLKPGTLDTPWTPEEDILLSQKVNEIGKHWKAISQFFKGRNQNNIKNRWNFHLKGGEALKNINIDKKKEVATNDIIINNNNVDPMNMNNSFSINNNVINDNINNNMPSNKNNNDFNSIKIDSTINNNNLITNNSKNNNLNNSKTSFENNSSSNNVYIDNNSNLNDNKIYISDKNDMENVDRSFQNNQDINSDVNYHDESHHFVIPLLNPNLKNSQSNQQVSSNSKIESNYMTEVFNDDEFDEFYNSNSCSEDFSNNFQFSSNSDQNSEQLQMKKIE